MTEKKKRKPRKTLTLLEMLDICDKIDMGVTYARIARDFDVTPSALFAQLKRNGFYTPKNKAAEPEEPIAGWKSVRSAPKNRTILGWVGKETMMIDGRPNRGYYCTVSWDGVAFSDGVMYHPITHWDDLQEPPTK